MDNNPMSVLLIASLTANACVLAHLSCSGICSGVTKNGQRAMRNGKLQENAPGFFGRICTSAPFLLIFPTTGLFLLATSGAAQNPFFAFTSATRTVFSIVIGHFLYKIVEVVYWRREMQYKPILIHHVVTVALYLVIIAYKQDAVLGIAGLFLVKSHVVFAEFDHRKISLFEEWRHCKLFKTAAVFAFFGSVVLNGIVPVSLLCAAVVTSSYKLLQMDYVPLAFFFLSLVFYSAVAAWFFTEAFKAFCKALRTTKIISLKKDLKSRSLTTIVNHNGLEKLYETANGSASISIRCNDLWDRDLSQLCSGPLYEKIKNVDLVEVQFETPIVLKSANLQVMDY
ncbi:predicted protein [Nematostella vectensis]|uniref:TLC domain-containing protein n=1 Tax=Nematostella vectensis TaxID=45351 RepID=A7SLR8_NEMVE|nr:predicted protein [Nematostella vectensis]|eukprot:XP_001627459.1 predicted protein [Nematostella vectensis]